MRPQHMAALSPQQVWKARTWSECRRWALALPEDAAEQRLVGKARVAERWSS
jgi:hypothetical protein